MEVKKKLRFIINPISGGRSKKDIPSLIDAYLDKDKFEIEITYTKTALHAKELAMEAVQKGIDMVVAVGGDGTINLVASALVQTETPLAIIPLGSGNGFARALKIPLEIPKAIQLINLGAQLRIDTGKANGNCFINVCGFGFDAHVSAKFAEAGTRGLKTYARISLKELSSYKNNEYELQYGNTNATEKAFILAICNGPQYGNNAQIAPKAKFDDAKFDVTLLKKVNWLNAFGITRDLFLGKLQNSGHVNTFQCQSIEVTQPSENWVNIDGEPIFMEQRVNIQMYPKSLTVIVPKHE